MKTLHTRQPRLITPAMFCALALSCGAASLAADHSDVPHTTVKYADLDLSNPQGAATLYSRIVVAANEVCKSFDIDNHGLADPLRRDECVRKTVADAVTKVAHPQLFAIYSAKTHQPLPIRVAAVAPR